MANEQITRKLDDPIYIEKLNEISEEFTRKHGEIINILNGKPSIKERIIKSATFHSSDMEHEFSVPKNASQDTIEEMNKRRRELLYYEAINHFKAFEYILGRINNGVEIYAPPPIDIELHIILMKDIMTRNAGVYRQTDASLLNPNKEERIRVSFTDPQNIYNELQELFNKIRKYKEDYGYYSPEFIAWAHAKFIKIHPFPDGNGRIGRLLMNHMLIESGFAPVIIQKGERYYSSMENALKKKSLICLAGYIAEKSIDTFKYLDKLIQSENIENTK